MDVEGLGRSYRVRPRKRARSATPGAAKKRLRRVPLVRMPRYIVGRTQRAKLIYHENVAITSVAAAESVGTHVFSANGCYDPNITGVGHQPRGFDQVMALYDHYTVIGASIQVRFLNNSTGTRPYCCIAVRDGTVAALTTRDLFEYSNRVISARPVYRLSTADESGVGASSMLSSKVDIAKFLGRKDVMDDPELKGTVASNPVEQVNFHVSVSDPVTTAAANVQCQVLITYDVIFHEPKNPASS